MEGLGQKLQQARLARGLTLDEAGRLTKIRPGKLAEIEAEDFSNFPSLAYAKGFLQIYGRFLDVDVTASLEAFETSDQMTVDGYSYLQDNPAPPPTRPTVVVRKAPRDRGSLLPLVIGVVVLVVGFTALKFFLDVQRIKPRAAAATPTPTATADRIVAPRALPVDGTPAPIAAVNRSAAAATSTPAITQSVAPTPAVIAAATPPPAATTAEPEVRRAEPVHPEDLAATENASPTPSSGSVNRVEIRPLRKTYVKVVVNNSDNPAIERWISASDGALKVSGQRVAIRVLDRDAVEIRKNGKRLAEDDPDVTVE